MPTALLSVYNKTGLVNFASRLAKAGWRLIGSNGTYNALHQAGLDVVSISEITGEPEMLDGRLKTLHSAIYAGLLARDTPEDRLSLAQHGWEPIDLVVVNLYPFEAVVSHPNTSLDKAIENIDIGGVTLLRAASKNHARVSVLCYPEDYPQDVAILQKEDIRRRLAYKAFAYTAQYEAAISSFFAQLVGAPLPFNLMLYPSMTLRYGENPHQSATCYSLKPDGTPLGGTLLQGKPLSYNNLLDLDAAWRTVMSYDQPAVVIVKHASPCGIATAPSLEDAVKPAIESDPVSAFGSVIACNRQVSKKFLELLGDLFIECLAVPDLTTNAQLSLSRRMNLRVLKLPISERLDAYEYRSVLGGFLVQTGDYADSSNLAEWQVVTSRQPNPYELETLRFAWKACQFVKSNAIVIAGAEERIRFTVGIGGGQPNRLDSVRIAGLRLGERSNTTVLASDAFFPFPDGIEMAASLDVTAIVQPGGSIRDTEVISAAEAAGISMIFTGVRHFRH